MRMGMRMGMRLGFRSRFGPRLSNRSVYNLNTIVINPCERRISNTKELVIDLNALLCWMKRESVRPAYNACHLSKWILSIDIFTVYSIHVVNNTIRNH